MFIIFVMLNKINIMKKIKIEDLKPKDLIQFNEESKVFFQVDSVVEEVSKNQYIKGSKITVHCFDMVGSPITFACREKGTEVFLLPKKSLLQICNDAGIIFINAYGQDKPVTHFVYNNKTIFRPSSMDTYKVVLKEFGLDLTKFEF